MKKAIICLTLALAVFASAHAQNEKYTKAMEDAIARVKFMTPAAELQQTAGQFERIAGAETAEWLPGYWAAYTYALLSIKETDAAKRDAMLDKANEFYKKVAQQQPDNDETMVLAALLANARLAIDPENRWQQYVPEFEAALGKAKLKNPENPRVYALQGQSMFYTPEQYGGGKAVACPVLKQAAEKFATFKPASTIHPSWGVDTNQYLLGQCGK
ncbi:hypothetical protein GCM10028803_57230 [Larkinella knui]|uniref:Tetratricopeptide repeat protein n=1 Tax=Larkinella knui TaxID=2025310 RepID=A0A3P1CIW2_9BACT|nr:hypothetical protein [Larkinella knui]RRB12834.1 hypothetical protein EHT87_21920 [Larkinella knui]